MRARWSRKMTQSISIVYDNVASMVTLAHVLFISMNFFDYCKSMASRLCGAFIDYYYHYVIIIFFFTFLFLF